MNIADTYTELKAIAATALPDFDFYGMYKSQYNTVRDVSDVVVIEPPRQWPLNGRDTCVAKFTLKVWIGLRISIKPEPGGTEQHLPFNEIEIRDQLMIAANVYVQAINSSARLRIESNLDGLGETATLYDAPEGQSTNWQAWVNFNIDLTSFGSSGTIPAEFVRSNYFTYILNFNL